MLSRYGFNSAAFEHLQQALQAGRFSPAHNRLQEPIEAAPAAAIHAWPTSADAELIARGQAAIDRGEVAVAVLNGGMATRFGGRVKGVVEVAGSKSFLALKLGELTRHRRVPIFLLNSFATEADTRAHLEAHRSFDLSPERLHLLTQHISLRLTPEGDLFRNAEGQVSYYAPGHGDLLEAMAESESFAAFRRGGGRLLCISNVDNLGATLDPKVVGSHLHSGKQMTTEVARRLPHDSGGAPVRRHSGRVEILEGFRFPESFVMDQLQAFNTNSFVVDVEAIAQARPLNWYRADKKVGEQPVVQFERLLGELTHFVDSHYLMVPRDGPEGRFLPVKTPDDIERVRADVQARFKL